MKDCVETYQNKSVLKIIPKYVPATEKNDNKYQNKAEKIHNSKPLKGAVNRTIVTGVLLKQMGTNQQWIHMIVICHSNVI